MTGSVWFGWWQEADWVVRGVFLVLVTLSVLSWMVILLKAVRFAGLTRGERAAGRVLDGEGTNREALDRLPLRLPTHALLDGALRLRAREGAPAPDRTALTGHLERWLGEIRLELGAYLTLLATIGNAAPFIGLFGTVWGIMHALQTLGGAANLTLEAVAGPVGEALVATAAGLFTAIPAVIGYNLLVRWQNRIMARVATNAQRVLDRALAAEG